MAEIPAIERMVIAAHEAGSPADQLERFYAAGYIPLPWQWPFHAACRSCDDPHGPTDIGAGGARGPGKSHVVFSQVALDDCQRFSGLKALFLRQTAKAARESFEDLLSKTIQGRVGYQYNRSDKRLFFDNGSRIILGGFHDDSDVDGYVGIEYDLIAVEEINQLSEERILKLRGSLRTTKQGWRERMYGSFNPGGVGHLYVKKNYVDPHKQGHKGRTRFFPSTYRDNPFLSQVYIDYLEGLPGALGKAWRDGDFDVFEGMAFPVWNYERHVIKPFELPTGWAKWRAVDWGYSAPFCCLWFARNPDNGRIYIYRELYAVGMTDLQQARAIADMTPPSESISTTFADPAMWSKKTVGDYVTSSADEYASAGVILTKADNNRLSGKRKVDRVLTDLPDGSPGLQVFSTCSNVVRTLPALSYDKYQVEDVDTSQEDHAFDTLKYGLSQVRELASPKKSKPVTHPIARLAGYG